MHRFLMCFDPSVFFYLSKNTRLKFDWNFKLHDNTFSVFLKSKELEKSGTYTKHIHRKNDKVEKP